MTTRGLNRFALGALAGLLLVAGGNSRATPANDAFTNSFVLSGMTNFVLGSNVGATRESGEPEHAGNTGGSSVWWTWTAPITGTFSASTAGSSFDTLLAVYLGSSLSNLIYVGSNDDSGGDSTSTVLFRAIAGEAYQIAVDGFEGADGDITLQLGPSGYPAPPWRLPTPFGSFLSSTDFHNKVLLIDFFETVCQACIEESPELIYLRRYHTNDGFEIIAIAKDNSLANITYNIRDAGIDYPVVVNTPAVEASYGGPLPLPTKFIVDREGKVQVRIEGANTLSYYNNLVVPFLRGAKNLKLGVRAEPGQIVLSWPGTEFGYGVEWAATLSGSYWMRLPFVPTEIDNQNTVILPATNQGGFYRLRKP